MEESGGSRSGGKSSKTSLSFPSGKVRKGKSEKVPPTVSGFVVGRTDLCYRMSDIVVSLLIIFPLVIGFWRGVWNLMDYYSKLYGVDPWLCLGVGYSIPMALYCLQEPLKRYIRPKQMNHCGFYIISRYLLLLHAFGSVNQWRGLWEWMDLNLGISAGSALGSLLVGIVLSVVLKTFNNVLAPPLFVAVDDAYDLHDCPLRFQAPPKSKCSYFIDCTVSVIFAASLVVLCWRGMWELTDIYLYPEDAIFSASVSLGLGYLVVLILLFSQSYINKTLEKLNGLLRLLVADLVSFAGLVSCVFAWRGLWMMYDEFLGTPNWSDWATAIIGGLGSTLLGCISTVVVRGVTIDGELMANGASDWPIRYVSLLQNPIYNIPFPEPWLFRFLCTTQKMNCHFRKKKVEKGSVEKNQSNQLKSQEVSHYPEAEKDLEGTGKMLSQETTTLNLRNIDSSSAEEDDSADEGHVILSLANSTPLIIKQSSHKPGRGVLGSVQSESYELKPLQKGDEIESPESIRGTSNLRGNSIIHQSV